MKGKRWRVIENEWNLRDAPWSAVGIEEVDDGQAVPAVVCWFTRGWDDSDAMARHVCDLHNRHLDQVEGQK